MLVVPNLGSQGGKCRRGICGDQLSSSWHLGSNKAPGGDRVQSRPASALLLCASSVLFCVPHHPGPGTVTLSVRHPFVPVPSAADWSLGEPLPLPRVTQGRGRPAGDDDGDMDEDGVCLCVCVCVRV